MLLLASSVCGLFKWRQFEPEMILLAVGWYLRFSLSYRDVEELLAERGLRADHVTVWRWEGSDLLSGTKYVWLKNPENWHEADQLKFAALRSSGCKVARALAAKGTLQGILELF